jgi:hypothetical protein
MYERQPKVFCSPLSLYFPNRDGKVAERKQQPKALSLILKKTQL